MTTPLPEPHADYHTHQPSERGGFLNSVSLQDWPLVAAAAPKMIPCFGLHPWHAEGADMAQLAFELDEWLTRYPQAGVGECGLDASGRWKPSLESQLVALQIQLGAAYRHERMAHLHGVGAWAELLEILRERKRMGTLPRTLLHAWNGSLEMAREFMALGAIFSVGLRELNHPKADVRYSRLPAERLFAESDDKPADFPYALAKLRLMQGNLKI